MIDEVLPACLIGVETRREAVTASLLPEEEPPVRHAAQPPRREVATGRACARDALSRLGRPGSAIPAGPGGEPRWPAGVVGSITHCTGFWACAVGLERDCASVGIDAEIDAPLPAGVLELVASPDERAALSEFTSPTLETVLFSAKEAVFKAWYPLTRAWLGFEDVRLRVHPRGGVHADLLVAGPLIDGRLLSGFDGRWRSREGLIVPAVVVPRRLPPAPDGVAVHTPDA